MSTMTLLGKMTYLDQKMTNFGPKRTHFDQKLNFDPKMADFKPKSHFDSKSFLKMTVFGVN